MKLVGVMLASALAVLAAGCVAASRTCVENAQTGPVEHAENTGEAYLTGVSVTRAGCADRVTFTFVRRLPGYRIEYRPTAEAQTEDASGRHIPVAGEAFLVVRLSGTRTARLTTGGSLVRTYAGPAASSPGTPAARGRS